MIRKIAQKVFVGISALCGICFSGAAVAADWHQASNYPAVVTSVNFAGGYSISQTTWGQWGSWKVSFGSTPPKATSQYAYGFFSVDIGGLQCTNSVAGSAGCFLRLTHSDKYDQDKCNVFPDQAGAKVFPGFETTCPTDISLAP